MPSNIHRNEGKPGVLTRQDKQQDPVNDQDRPEDRNIKDGEPGADESDGEGARGGMPELELGKTSDERTELVVLSCGEARGACVAVLEALILCKRGVEFWLQEQEEEV